MVRRIPSRQRNTRVARERDRGAFLRLGLLLLCGLILTGGFLYAGVQHFAALKLGYQTQNLRRIRDSLAEDQRRFLFEWEAAASPARLELAARHLGMQPMQAAQIDPLKRAVNASADRISPAVTGTPALAAKSAPVKLIRQPKPLTQTSSQQTKLIQARAR
jgi:cell division protein FtsL